MDVDLLRPGTVPIAPETILWFEFLLDPNLLQNHLNKPVVEPTPVELISKFAEVINDTLKNTLEIENVDHLFCDVKPEIKIKQPSKNVALKIMILKIAAHIYWDIGQIRLLPFKHQLNVIQDLIFYTNDKLVVDIPVLDSTPSNPQHLFALLIYHRWLLNVAMHRITTNWKLKVGSFDISPTEETIICTMESVNNTVTFLINALDWDTVPDMLTYDCFQLPTEANEHIEHNWSNSKPISKEELTAQVSFELGAYFFSKEDYKQATEFFTTAHNFYKKVVNKDLFVHFDKDILDMYIKACCGPFDQLNSSIVNNYVGITAILQKDNVLRKIPLSYRINLELDIQGAMSSGSFYVAKDLLQQVKMLNLIRCVLDQKCAYHIPSSFNNNTDVLLWALQSTWKMFPNKDKQAIKEFLLHLIVKNEAPNLLQEIQSNAVLKDIFDSGDLSYIAKYKDDIEIPSNLLSESTDLILLEFNQRKSPKFEVKQLEQRLIATYDSKVIRELLTTINVANLEINVFDMNPHWHPPVPILSVLRTMNKGFLQDFLFVMLAKYKEFTKNQNWDSALDFLNIISEELKLNSGNTITKLCQMIEWEVLLVQIEQLHSEWPKVTIDKNALANACEQCLQSTESVKPRLEVSELCIVGLLNLGRWDFLINIDKHRLSITEITAGIAVACQELMKSKGNKKFSKTLWDLVLPIFLIPPHQKRGNMAIQAFREYQWKKFAMFVFTRLRASLALSIVISLITKLYNHINYYASNESTNELQTEYIQLWPATISNAPAYDGKLITEILIQLVTQGLQYYPTNIAWLRLKGDIYFGKEHYQSALKYYLQSLLILTDYFNLPVRNDDNLFRKMIKCCTSLNCYTQAGVLCQFLEEPDYALAFKVLGENRIGNDAVDSYYHCFWDINILEYLVHIHNKRGEFQRRKCAIQVMGLLELNSSNHEEIQREASNLRKSTFLRALCKQYVF